jgi:raffinose/stachyose/melibiose transport system permease protein
MPKFRFPQHVSDKSAIYLMVLPAILLYAIFFIFPVLEGLTWGFYNWEVVSPTKTYVGLSNLTYLASNSDFQRALINTLIITAVFSVAQLVIGFSLAWLARKTPHLGDIFMKVALLPFILSFVAIGVMWHWIYDPNFGLLNGLLNSVGLHSLTTEWTANTQTALFSVILANIWGGMGLFAVIYSAGLQTIPQSIYDAMKVDALSDLQKIRRVVLPYMKDAISLSLVLAISSSFQIFALVYVLTASGPGLLTDVLSTALYRTAFKDGQAGLACAIGMVMFLFSMAIVVVQVKLLGGGKE